MRPFRTPPLLFALLASSVIGLPALAEAPVAANPSVPPVVVPRLDPAAEAFRDGLGRSLAGTAEGERAAIDGFFAARGYTPFWTEPGSPRATALIDALAAAGDQALPAGRYDAEGLGLGASEAGPEREVVLTRAYLAYAGDLSSGVIDPSAVDDEITRRPVRAPA